MSMTEPHANNASNFSQASDRNISVHNINHLSRVGLEWINKCLKMFFFLLSIPWLVSVVMYSAFDTKCIIYEQASVLNCSQKLITSEPRYWVFAWLLISVISSFVFLIIIRLNQRTLNYQLHKARKIYKKASFASLMFLLVISCIYYFIRIFTKSDRISVAISVLLFLWAPVSVMVVCSFNYLPRVRWKSIRQPGSTFSRLKICFQENSNFIIYWLALSLYFVEITIKLTSVMLDVVHDVAPMIQGKFTEESSQFHSVMLIVIGLRLTFHVRLLLFFWEKLFHGEKDLITEPNTKLVEESPLTEYHFQANGHRLQGEIIELEEIICG